MISLFLKKFIIHCWLGRFKSLFLTFSFNKAYYHYFYHQYNSTWRNERTVEIPIIWKKVQQYQPSDVLEVGNVLAHYFPVNHLVIDKYEQVKNVKNIDIVNFKSKKKYSLIVSISTLEHIGWDEPVKDPQKIKMAIRVLGKHLKPGGELWLTFPLGYNSYLDKFLKNGELPLNKFFFLKRSSLFGIWKEVSQAVIKEKSKYGSPFSNANVICVGMLRVSKS